MVGGPSRESSRSAARGRSSSLAGQYLVCPSTSATPPAAASAKDATAAEANALTGRLVLEGSCSDGLTHTLDSRVAELRSKHRTPIYCGDWELRVVAVPREQQSFSDFVAEYPGEQEEEKDGARTEYASGSICPADSLWELTNFGELFWEGPGDWFLPQGEQWHCKRIWVELDPRGGSAGVLEAREEALQQLDALPGSELPANAACKIAHAARIKADLDLLDELVAQRGSIGDTVLPDALQPIIEWHALHSDGNFRNATFATANYCFSISMSTS
eukprot:3855051-Prymnesium_polylepis.1